MKGPRAALSLGAAAFILALPISAARAAGPADPIRLVGAFSITPGACAAGGAPTGSYLEIDEGGLPVPNPSSPCAGLGQLYTPLTQGAAGLLTGRYQLDPVPTFDADGDALAAGIIRPVPVLGAALGLATTCADQQAAPTETGACAGLENHGHPVPTISAEPAGEGACPASSAGDCLFGDLSSLSLDWSGFAIGRLLPIEPPTTCTTSAGCYAQGVAEGPDGARPQCTDGGGGCSLGGTYDPATGAYRLDVQSPIRFGLLQGMTVQYVLIGTFRSGPVDLLPPAGPLLPPDAPLAGTAPTTIPTSTAPGSPRPPPPSAPPAAPPAAEAAPAPGETGGLRTLDGTFVLGPVSCPGGQPSGSYLEVSGLVVFVNPNSTCDGGAYTLLPPGTAGLPTDHFAPDPDPTFDGSGNSLSGTIIRPVPFGGHDLGMATSPDDEQDAPAGPATFSAPTALLQGTSLVVDLRALEVTYNGPSGASCASSSGLGCWESGSRAALGTFDPTTSTFSLDWFSGQAFTGASGGVEFHLEGHFVGRVAEAPPGMQLIGLPPQYVVTSTSVVNGDAPGGASAPGSRGSAGSGGSGGSAQPGHIKTPGGHRARPGAPGETPGATVPMALRAGDLDGLATLAGLLLAVVGVAALLVGTGATPPRERPNA